MKRRLSLAAAIAILGATMAPGAAIAHTESDLVAVPAGAEATLELKPTHGCGGSPTVAVAIRAPLEGATAVAVAGWTATATADGQGNTVLEWSGGSLPADQTGEFPVTFTAPDTPGELLIFPSIQTCENGQELSWISGDPEADYPAPRLLVLPAGSDPATSIDEVPADAPGRDQLVEIVDVDGPGASTTTTPEDEAGTSTTASPATTSAPDPSSDDTPVAPADDVDDTDDDSSNLPLVVGGVIVLAGVVIGIIVAVRRARS